MPLLLPSTEELERLAARAVTDDKALQELGALNERLARAANQRIRELEKKGETGDAYQWLIRQTGKNRLSQAKTGGAEYLLRQATAAKNFLKRKESTISGIRAVQKQTAATIAKRYGLNGLKGHSLKRFNDFLKTDAFSELKKFLGSDIIRDLMEGAQENSLDDLLGAYEQYLSGKTDDDLLTIYEDWKDGNLQSEDGEEYEDEDD